MLKTSLIRTNQDVFREMVLFQDEVSKKSHRDLFSFEDASYRPATDNIIEAIFAIGREGPDRLHVSAGWDNILRMALWTSESPRMHDVILLMRKAGATEEELKPFKASDVNDLFPWLYYGKRSDILRRICNTAKSQAESRLRENKVLVYCHLVSAEVQKIVASSL